MEEIAKATGLSQIYTCTNHCLWATATTVFFYKSCNIMCHKNKMGINSYVKEPSLNQRPNYGNESSSQVQKSVSCNASKM